MSKAEHPLPRGDGSAVWGDLSPACGGEVLCG